MHIIEKATLFSKVAHESIGQKRKYTNDPYYIHPLRVAAAISAHQGAARFTNEAVAAALLHDVVEDTNIKLDFINAEFGSRVMFLVHWLTEPKFEGNRASRKTKEVKRWLTAPFEAKSIKLADLIDNTDSIVKHDPSFAKVYLREKRAMLEVLRGGYPLLWDEAHALLERADIELSQK